MLKLDVVNRCLGSMGQVPLNSLTEPHRFKGAALALLTQIDKQVQAKGWWCNKECLTLSPSGLDSAVYLPGDTINVETNQRGYIQRGRRLYDRFKGTYTFTAPVSVTLIRLVPFEDLPELLAALIAADVVVRFQAEYDGDRAKAELLVSEARDARLEANAENIRQSEVNLHTSNYSLNRIKRKARGVRGFTL